MTIDGAYTGEQRTLDCSLRSVGAERNPCLSDEEVGNLEVKYGLDLSTGCLVQPFTEAKSTRDL